MKKYIICGMALVSFAFAKAQTSSIQNNQKKWTLSECVEYALQNNISIKQSELDLEAVDADKLEALGNILPSINANARASESSGFSVNPITNRPQVITNFIATGGVNLGYNVFDGLRNIRQIQRAKISKLASQYRLDNMKDDISLLVANNYLQILTNKANLQTLIAQNKVTKEQISQTQELVDAGQIPRGDLLEVKAQDATEQQQIIAAENAVTISKVSLAQLLLIKDYENFDVVDSEFEIIDESFAQKSVNELISSAEENRSEVRIAEQDMEIAEKDLQIARGAYFPTLSAFFGYDTRFTNSVGFDERLIDPNIPLVNRQIGFVQGSEIPVLAQVPNTEFVETGSDPFLQQLWENDGIAYGFSLSVPIFNGFNTRANVQRSKINLERTKYQLEQAKLDLESNVYQAYVDAQGSKKSYEAAITALESQELAYDYAKERYDVGLTNAFDFSQSKLRFNNAKINLNQAKFDYLFRLKVLELFFGVEPSELKL